MEIKLANGHKIVAELYDDIYGMTPPEIVVYIADEDGVVIQDLVLVRSRKNDQDAQVLVWTDEYDENYTHQFNINEYKGE